MLDNETLTREAASYKRDAERRFDAALTALLALAWKYKSLGEGFSFEADDELYAAALEVCIALSDGCAADARERLSSILDYHLDYYDENAAWDSVEDQAVESFDMAGSHLLKLLDVWVAVALVNGYTKEHTRTLVLQYLRNPLASGLLTPEQMKALDWGRGYMRDVRGQLVLIGQDAIIGGARHAEWVDAMAQGATYYIVRRGSDYNCPLCDSLANRPVPIDEPFEPRHPRCVCVPEYHFEPMP